MKLTSVRKVQISIIRFSQFSGCCLILSVYIIMSFDFPFVRLFGIRDPYYMGGGGVIMCAVLHIIEMNYLM
jgi:uncharacterized membrane protein